MAAHMGLSTPSLEQAKRWLADAGIFHHLEVAVVTPGGTPEPRWLGCLLDMVEFLVPVDEGGRLSETVNFADPGKLVTWVREDVGDTELADRMAEVLATSQGYRRLAPQFRELALARVVQCFELVKQEEPQA